MRLVIDIISMSLRAAKSKLGFFEISLLITTLVSLRLKSCISSVIIIGQISVKSSLRFFSDSRMIRMRIEKRMRISRAGWAYSLFFKISEIFGRRVFSSLAYTSFEPEYSRKQILSKLFTRFLLSAS